MTRAILIEVEIPLAGGTGITNLLLFSEWYRRASERTSKRARAMNTVLIL